MSRGVFYSAYGAEAVKECLASITALRRSNPSLPICVAAEDAKPFRTTADRVIQIQGDPYGRIPKLSADKLSPFDETLYLDADTRVHFRLDLPFQALEDGFDFVVTLSTNQERGTWLWHLEEGERDRVLEELGFYTAQFQGGVWGFRKTPETAAFFAEWRALYSQVGEREQGAMQLAFHRKPMRTYIIGRDYNGGAIIQHRFGQARRRDVRG